MDLMVHRKEHTPHSAKGRQQDLGLPYGAKIFVMAGGEGFWLNSLRMKDSLRFDSWDIRTTLSDEEAKAWAAEARDSQEQGECMVYVVLFLDGKLDKSASVEGDSTTGTVRVFRQKFTLEDAIGTYACSLEANLHVTNDIPLGSPLSYQLTL
jgi:hypothetical protein